VRIDLEDADRTDQVGRLGLQRLRAAAACSTSAAFCWVTSSIW
jgi:hypothetical protein